MSKESASFAPFDAADYLDSEEAIAEFLAAAAEEDVESPGVFMHAVEAVAKARGIAQVAADSGLSRESLYKALAPGAQPRFDTVRRVLGALGVGLAVVPREKIESRRAVPRTASGASFAKKARPSKVARTGASKARGPRPDARRNASRESGKPAR